eukprot:1131408-Pelagomonas_calceolata.AAC.1
MRNSGASKGPRLPQDLTKRTFHERRCACVFMNSVLGCLTSLCITQLTYAWPGIANPVSPAPEAISAA